MVLCIYPVRGSPSRVLCNQVVLYTQRQLCKGRQELPDYFWQVSWQGSCFHS